MDMHCLLAAAAVWASLGLAGGGVWAQEEMPGLQVVPDSMGEGTPGSYELAVRPGGGEEANFNCFPPEVTGRRINTRNGHRVLVHFVKPELEGLPVLRYEVCLVGVCGTRVSHNKWGVYDIPSSRGVVDPATGLVEDRSRGRSLCGLNTPSPWVDLSGLGSGTLYPAAPRNVRYHETVHGREVRWNSPIHGGSSPTSYEVRCGGVGRGFVHSSHRGLLSLAVDASCWKAEVRATYALGGMTSHWATSLRRVVRARRCGGPSPSSGCADAHESLADSAQGDWWFCSEGFGARCSYEIEDLDPGDWWRMEWVSGSGRP